MSVEAINLSDSVSRKLQEASDLISEIIRERDETNKLLDETVVVLNNSFHARLDAERERDEARLQLSAALQEIERLKAALRNQNLSGVA